LSTDPRSKQVVGRQRELELVRAALASGAHILLEGPPGTGKSTLLRQVARSRHTEFVLVEGSAELTPARLIGSFDPALVLEQGYRPQSFSDGPLVRAMRDGGLLYVEELNRVPEETIKRLRAAALRLGSAIVLERARAGRVSMSGISRLRPVRGAADGDLDIDASIEGVLAARAEARPVALDDLTTVHWARAQTAFAVVVDRSGSMSGARLAAAATVAAACALRAPREHAVLSFAASVDLIRPLASEIVPAVVAERLLRLRGHGVTRLSDALTAAREQLAHARARRRVVILLSDCRSTDDDDTLEVARTLPELIILAPADDHEQAAQLADLAGARWAALADPLDAAAALDYLLEARITA
jgi:Mg-chelatase subunit ChlD